MEKYAPLNDYHRWIFELPVITENDLKSIHPFSEEYASQYWTNNIYFEQHLQIGPAKLYWLYYGGKNKNSQTEEISHWIYSLKEAEYNWMDDWNDDNIQGLLNFLSNNTDLPDDERIVFFWTSGSGLETRYGIFKRNWINFLYDDESPILLCPRTGFAIRFGPTGTLYMGYKKEPFIE